MLYDQPSTCESQSQPASNNQAHNTTYLSNGNEACQQFGTVAHQALKHNATGDPRRYFIEHGDHLDQVRCQVFGFLLGPILVEELGGFDLFVHIERQQRKLTCHLFFFDQEERQVLVVEAEIFW
jgi:hypothetical protein